MPELSALLLVDLALAITGLELLLLLLLRRSPLALTLLAGLALMLALRLGLAGASLPWMALALGAGGVLHAVDLRRRWSSTAPLLPSLRESPP